jgi:hypothetical protein
MALLSRRPRLKPEVRQDLINQFLSTNDAEILAAPVSEPGVFVAAYIRACGGRQAPRRGWARLPLRTCPCDCALTRLSLALDGLNRGG